jgi:hypothetical protein
MRSAFCMHRIEDAYVSQMFVYFSDDVVSILISLQIAYISIHISVF